MATTMLDETRNSLTRIQKFDPSTLARTLDFGAKFNFSGAVPPATRLVNLFRQVSVSGLDDFPPGNLQQIRQLADALYSVFDQIEKFDITGQSNAAGVRDQLIQQLEAQYDSTWSTLHPYISYSASKATDFQRLEREARAAVQSIEDRTTALMTSLAEAKAQAEAAVEAARSAAAEQGVSQQAVYFRNEATEHEAAAKEWRQRTQNFAIGLGLYAAAALVFHKIPFLKPSDGMESAQLITSKILVFAVIAYMLLLSARNFLSHKHNAIVNRHRQNALMTFNALASAANGQAAKDIILTHAASCIFAPQETGYAKSTGGQQDSNLGSSIIGLISKADGKSTSGAVG